ncbi:MAG: hypothetical protein CVT88_07680 [Candidatus Altiarchaeales archaeon HGW-Altiarchaeales-1]|nr:MAG: hypothetical protein CVT88_07680 [Candidatus Altiarchaeales archaeon HGW-Altiarchaeales-1]
MMTNYKMFIDANIFIFTITENPKYIRSCEALLNSIRNNKIKAYTSVNVVEEVVYKIMMFELVEKYALEFKEIKSFLKKNPEVVRELEKPWRVLNDIKNLMEILDVTYDDLSESGNLSKKYSLLPNDALSVAVMKRNNIWIIASNDSDFERADEIEVWVPDAG